MRNVYLITAFVVVLTLSILGLRGGYFTKSPIDVFPDTLFPGMKFTSKVRTQGEFAFFSDGRADRLPPTGVVAHSQPFTEDDSALYLGKSQDGSWVRGYPASIKVDLAFVQRGKERYAIYCAPCHGSVGDGNGVTKRYGMGATPSYHDDRIRQLPEGDIFDVITNGKGPAYQMSGYADKIEPKDRWAIVAYVRSLQRAQLGTINDVPAQVKMELSK
jgi:mono/diheme cytochrome c family protein